MEIKQAIEILKYIQSFDGLDYGATNIALSMGIQSLEKDISRPVIIQNWTPARCPSCNQSLSEHIEDGYYHHMTHLNVCPNEECRQRLKWE